MKKIYYAFVLLIYSINMFGQAKKPELMVVPSLPWCNERGYVVERQTELGSEILPDYKKALAQDKDLMNVISKIGILMADKGFPLKDLSASIKNMEIINAQNAMTLSKNSGAALAESALDMLKRTAKCDMFWKSIGALIPQDRKSRLRTISVELMLTPICRSQVHKEQGSPLFRPKFRY
jgi:hypothetical protein